MSQLQKLLDEKWRLDGDLSDTDRSTLEMFRRIFTEGYNAAMEAAKDAIPHKDDSGRPDAYYGDTPFDSLSTIYGYNLAISHVNENLNKL